jgi:hypothetical protein
MLFSPAGCMFAQQLNSGSVLHGKSSLLAAEFRKSTDRSISKSISSKPVWILGSSSQNVAKHDLNMQLDPGFRSFFACWMHVFSEAEFWISVHEKSSRLAAEFRKSTDRSISSSISSKPEWILGSSSQSFAKHDLNMQLDPGFRAFFACWMHVFSEAEFWISVHEKSSRLAAEFRKSTDRSISKSISSKPEWISDPAAKMLRSMI